MAVLSITAADVKAKIREIAAERPTYTYVKPSDQRYCLYVHEDASGNPINGEGCIVGQALVALGADPSTLIGRIIAAGALLEDFVVINDTADIRWCEDVQDAQDNGAEWYEAVEEADEFEAKRIAQDAQ